ncbi:sugar phosphate isomerase/epimerase family protein [Enterocloster clostridioformis]|uniref:Sugar phosphate isomerase/epimerase n=1 Tax=Enterocloster clostridioformis TaxID=1531 RepID=A0A1I0F1E7_9FIRM|nr:TIM barrel protein [Enterocloster clostridioformis]SET51204.1 Sugar phosphate isomerase/epimerase [Enterocloster clostridioformis]SEW18708.1 Sugar phosphate isomerase/epimerase [Enterocloster clostridioformis]
MEQSMRRFMKVGIILHVSYPQLGGGDGPILECLERICGDDYFEAVEVARMKDPQVRKQAAEMIRMAHMVSAYGGQSRTLSAGLNINDLDETRRAMAVDTLKEGIDEAYEMVCAGFSFLSGRYEEERKEQAFEQLLKSTRELCRHAEKEGQMPVCCEVFDYDIDKKALIGPAVLAARYAGEIRKEHGNFGLLVDLSHIPMVHETIEESILPVKDYIIHAHMGNTVIKSPDCEAYGDNHPRFGFPNSENDVEELAHYLRTLKEIGFLGEKDRPVVSFEVKPWKDEPPEVVIANAKRTLNLAWELV